MNLSRGRRAGPFPLMKGGWGGGRGEMGGASISFGSSEQFVAERRKVLSGRWRREIQDCEWGLGKTRAGLEGTREKLEARVGLGTRS